MVSLSNITVPVFLNVRDKGFQQVNLIHDGFHLGIFLVVRVIGVLVHQLLVAVRTELDHITVWFDVRPGQRQQRPSACGDVIRRAHVSKSRGLPQSISVLEQILGC